MILLPYSPVLILLSLLDPFNTQTQYRHCGRPHLHPHCQQATQGTQHTCSTHPCWPVGNQNSPSLRGSCATPRYVDPSQVTAADCKPHLGGQPRFGDHTSEHSLSLTHLLSVVSTPPHPKGCYAQAVHHLYPPPKLLCSLTPVCLGPGYPSA